MASDEEKQKVTEALYRLAARFDEMGEKNWNGRRRRWMTKDEWALARWNRQWLHNRGRPGPGRAGDGVGFVGAINWTDEDVLMAKKLALAAADDMSAMGVQPGYRGLIRFAITVAAACYQEYGTQEMALFRIVKRVKDSKKKVPAGVFRALDMFKAKIIVPMEYKNPESTTWFRIGVNASWAHYIQRLAGKHRTSKTAIVRQLLRFAFENPAFEEFLANTPLPPGRGFVDDR